MTVDDIVTYFGDVNKAAEFFEVSPEAIYQWKGRPDQLIPKGRATEAQVRTAGALVYKPELYAKK